jgi:hypothetical protein
MNRLRPNRAQRTAQSIEQALGSYLRNVLRDGRQLESSESVDIPPPSTTPEFTMTGDFQRFLQVLQLDLVAAVRDFAAPPESEPEEEIPPPEPEAAEGEERPIPTFHRQRGQNLPGTQRSTGVSGGHDGLPRRLNFFRAHLFPPIETASPDDAVVPCIFIGVRSIAHDPTLTTDQLVHHPSFPFIDGQVPASNPPAEEASDLTAESPRRTFRERVMDRINARRNPSPAAPLNTYLVYVIGGNYPRNHPVLRIPNLITGGPLTDEELHLVSEIMGPARPPTASPAEIQLSGLRIVDGSLIAEMASKGEVLEICEERCLVSRSSDVADHRSA